MLRRIVWTNKADEIFTHVFEFYIKREDLKFVQFNNNSNFTFKY